MSFWFDITTIGSGTVDYRLMVEGWPHEWVTNSRITHANHREGRTVYAGLQYKGLRLSERTVLKDAWPTVGGMTVTIVPTESNEDTLNGFTRDVQKVANLVNTIGDSDTTWTTLPPNLGAGYYHLATETVQCDGSNNIARAIWDTRAQRHVTQDGNRQNPVPLYNWPPTMEGRRAYLYAYGTGDDVAEEGTLIWRGVVEDPPRMGDGLSWNITLAPITTLFNQNISGGDKSEYKVRGVYHSNQCPMFFSAGVGYDGIVGSDGVGWFFMSGFYETQDEWAAAVNDQLTALVGTPTTDVTFIQYGNTDGHPFITVGSSGDDVVHLLVKDVLDGDYPITGQGNSRNFNVVNNVVQLGDSSGQFVVQGTTYQPPWGYPLPYARAMVGSPVFNALGGMTPWGYRPYTDITFPTAGYPSDGGDPAGDWPSNRLYLESVDGLEVGMTLCVRDGEDGAAFLLITDINTDPNQRWITVDSQNQGRPVYVSDQHTLVPVGMYGANTNWAGFMDNVVAKSPEANLGRTPHITASDVNNTGWLDLWDTYPFPAYWKRRNYNFLKPTTVKDILVPEFQATGWMGRLNLAGQLDVALMPFVSPQRTAQHSITDDEILLPAEGMFGQFPTWEAQRDGLINIAYLRLGYSPITDEYDSKYDFVVRMSESVSEHKSGDKAKQEIAPKSTPGAGTRRRAAALAAIASREGNPSLMTLAPTSTEIVDMVTPYLRTLSVDYATVTIAVPFTKFNILCGDIVSITSRYIPNGVGGRGVTGKKAICVGREWDLDPASNRMGLLTFWFSRDLGKTAGYGPTGRITGRTNVSGDTWNLSLSPLSSLNIAWSEDGDGDVAKHFAVGDAVEVIETDVTAESRVVGTVIAKPSSSSIRVTFTSTWTPGSSIWNVRFFCENETLPDPTERQKLYCFVSDAAGLSIDNTAGRSFV